jgi:hypothetical protein
MVAIKPGGKQLTSFILIPVINLLAMNLPNRDLYRRVSCDSELNSKYSGVPDHQCHTPDHEAYLSMVH